MSASGSKETYLRRVTSIGSLLVHVGFMSVALIAAYNTYKEIGTSIYDKYFLSKAAKIEIKDTFPWVVILFVILSILTSIRCNSKGPFLTLRQYGAVLLLLVVISNPIFLSKGPHVICVLNLSYFYLAIALIAWRLIGLPLTTKGRGAARLMPDIPPIMLSPNFFISIFLGLMVVCALFTILQLEKFVETSAIIAYYALAVGVGITVYELIKHGNAHDDKEPD